MGYTHYTDIKGGKLKVKEFNDVVADIFEIEAYIKKNKVKCVTAGSCEGEPILLDLMVFAKVKNKAYTPTKLYLNGVGENSHETLCIEVGKQDDMNNFCKTSRKPYDTAVCLALISLNYFVPHAKITSDGWASDWQGAIDLWHVIFPDRKDYKFELK